MAPGLVCTLEQVEETSDCENKKSHCLLICWHSGRELVVGSCDYVRQMGGNIAITLPCRHDFKKHIEQSTVDSEFTFLLRVTSGVNLQLSIGRCCMVTAERSCITSPTFECDFAIGRDGGTRHW